MEGMLEELTKAAPPQPGPAQDNAAAPSKPPPVPVPTFRGGNVMNANGGVGGAHRGGDGAGVAAGGGSARVGHHNLASEYSGSDSDASNASDDSRGGYGNTGGTDDHYDDADDDAEFDLLAGGQ